MDAFRAMSLSESVPDDVNRHLITNYLHVSDILILGRTCRYFRALLDQHLAAPALTLSGTSVTDPFLGWLLRRVPKGSLRSLDLNECSHVSRVGVIRALRNGNACGLETLNALSLGGASWTTDELRRLVNACPSLRALHADCRAKGVGADSLDVLSFRSSPLLPRRLVVHRAKTSSGADDGNNNIENNIVDAALAVADNALLAPEPPAAADPATATAAMNAAAAVLDGTEGADTANAADEAEEEQIASQAAAFGEALTRCVGSLEELDVRGGVLDQAGVAQVSRHLKTDSNILKKLLLPGANSLAEPARMRLFAAALARSERLEHLQLGCSAINAANATVLAKGLHANKSLKLLELQHNPLLDAGACALGRALSVNTSLRTLAVPFTGLGDAACAALAHALKHGNSGLTNLDLAGNRLTANGLETLAAALPFGKLEGLTLSANAGVGPRGAVAIASALSNGANTIKRLRLDGCCVGPSPCGRLSAALAASHVESFDLSSNEIGDMGAWELAWRLPECANGHLREIKLAINEIEEDGASELLSALENSKESLTMLDLRGNRLAEDGATLLALKATERCNVAFQRAVPVARPRERRVSVEEA